MILYYDDTCRFCSKSITFLKKRNARMRYIGLSKAVIPSRLKNIDSIILENDGLYYVYADAAIRAVCTIGGIYKIVFLSFLIPRFIRDWVYKQIAKKRYCLATDENTLSQ